MGQLRQAWRSHRRQSLGQPFLSDEDLGRLCAEFCGERDCVPTLKGLERPLAWHQVLSALICLAAAAGCVVYMCGSDDVPMRVLTAATAVFGLLLAVWSLFPRLSLLFPLYAEECAASGLPYVGMGLRRCAPVGVTILLVVLYVFPQPVGDGYQITTVCASRIGVVDNVTYLLAHMA